MNQDSDNDSSSDSSSDFLVPAGKIDLNSSFFTETHTKPQKARKDLESSDNSENEFDDSNDNNISSAELLSQVLQNLEKTKNTIFEVNINQASTSKTADQILKHSKDDLSKEINNLLLQGESATSLNKEDGDSSDETDTKALNQPSIPEKGVEIHLPGQNFMFNKQKKKQQDLQKLLQNKINQKIRKTQVFIHKVGLLSWLCHGFFLNKLINDPELLGISLSLVSSNNYPDGRVDLKYLEGFTKWFRGLFQVCDINKKIIFTKDYLLSRISEKKIYNYVELILLYIATVRAISINCRLIVSLQPPSLKPKKEQLFQILINEKNESVSKENNEVKVEENKTKSSSKVQNKKKTSKKKLKSEEEALSKAIPKNSQEADKVANLEAKKKAASILAKKTTVIDKHKTDIIDESNVTTKKLCLRSNKNVELKKTEINSSKNNKSKTGKSKIQPDTKRQHSSSSNEEFSEEENNFSTDEEYVQKKPKKKILKKNKESIALKIAGKIKNQRKLLSSDDEEDSIKNTYNFWVEVYVESEESWISVDVLNKKIHCVSEIYKKANHPVLYVVAWNSVGTLKDVTRRYCPHWLTDTRKKRVDEQWWQDTLSTWKEKKTAISKAEDEQLLRRELEQPLPKTVSECKGHPLYVLTRHLLKFEALYPPDVVPLGHLKAGEAIYSRHCVHTLYSRETWVKKARVVKPAQEPYKIVKSMPKYDKLSGMKIKDQPLELFGRWQTTPYEPPEAKDGKVPRNAYGNVDLFKMCMLPKGTVYINLPGLSRVARKLNIDCAPACVGFNFGGRGALPAFEGFIVCKEFEDTLREAWEEEQIESQKRAEEKREKRIYGNWKKLIKGLLIRERLAAKYNFREDEDEHVDDVQKRKQKKIEPKQRTDAKKTSTTSKRIKKQPQDSSKKVKR